MLRDTVAEAHTDAATAMDAVLASLRDNDAADRDITTTQLSISPEYDFRGPEERVLLGFRVSNQVAAKVRNLGSVGTLLNDAIAAGGDQIVVNGINFSIEDPTPLVDQARDLAVQRAKAKAEALADLSDLKIGGGITIFESWGAPPSPITVTRLDGAIAEAQAFAPSSPIQGGEITVSILVVVTFTIE